MAHIATTNFYGNPNIGLYAFATDDYCFVGYDFKKSIRKQIEDILKVPVHSITIAGTPMVGVFAAGNKNCLLVPSIAFEEELEALDKLNIKYKVIETKLTALGNNILCNDNGCIVNPDFSDREKKLIKEALEVGTVTGRIADVKTVGSCAIANKTHCLVHRDAEKKELALITKTLNAESDTGTVNMANPYVKSGIICNSNGILVGDASGGPEVNNADHVLGYLDG
ncbi:translation initiation factor IF-6 [Candidatus Woesearchaeota archaeon]|nr:translation initiation factor IF-6 [Candidatus Woesearchaeota archaeon]